MTREQMIELLSKHNYRLNVIDDDDLRHTIDSLGYVEYMDETLNIYDLEEAGLLEDELIDQTLIGIINAILPNQFIFDQYVKCYKDKYSEDFLISKETGLICWQMETNILRIAKQSSHKYLKS